MKNKKIEQGIQIQFVSWFKLQYKKHEKLIFAFKNETAFVGDNSVKSRGIFFGNLKKQKNMGVTKGVPDIFIACPIGCSHGLFIEFKAPKKKPEPEQLEIHEILRSQGYKVEWHDNFDDAKKTVDEYFKIRFGV